MVREEYGIDDNDSMAMDGESLEKDKSIGSDITPLTPEPPSPESMRPSKLSSVSDQYAEIHSVYEIKP
jgi:hypothetical protein